MVLLCAICRTYADKKKNLSFFKIPKDERRRLRWNEICGFNLRNTSRICQKHFKQSDFINAPGKNKHPRLMPSAVPIVPPDAPIIKPFKLFRKLEVVVMEDPLVTCPSRKGEENENDDADDIIQSLPTDAFKSSELEMDNEQTIEELRIDNMIITELEDSLELNVNPGAQKQKTQAERCAEHEFIICRDKLEIMDLKKKLRQLEREVAHLKQEQRERMSLESCLYQLFTENQIKRLKNPNKKFHWNSDDISNAVSLQAAGPAAYEYLFHNGFPLPSLSTLKSWAQKK